MKNNLVDIFRQKLAILLAAINGAEYEAHHFTTNDLEAHTGLYYSYQELKESADKLINAIELTSA
jgi:hypothetical protein